MGAFTSRVGDDVNLDPIPVLLKVAVKDFKLLDTNTQSDLVVCSPRQCCRCSLAINLNTDVYYHFARCGNLKDQMLLMCGVCYKYQKVFVDPADYVRFYRSIPDPALQALAETVCSIYDEKETRETHADEGSLDDEAVMSRLSVIEASTPTSMSLSSSPALSGHFVNDPEPISLAENEISEMYVHAGSSLLSGLTQLAIELQEYSLCDCDDLEEGLALTQIKQILRNIHNIITQYDSTSTAPMEKLVSYYNSINCRDDSAGMKGRSKHSDTEALLGPPDTVISLLCHSNAAVHATISAHGGILSARSTYFMTQLFGAWSPQRSNGCKINSADKRKAVELWVDDAVFEEYIKLAYWYVTPQVHNNRTEFKNGASKLYISDSLSILLASMYVLYDDLRESQTMSTVIKGNKIESVCLAWLLAHYFDASDTREILTTAIIKYGINVNSVLYLIEWAENLLASQASPQLPAHVQAKVNLGTQEAGEECWERVSHPCSIVFSSRGLENIRAVSRAATAYLYTHMVELALTVDCTSRFGLISVSKNQLTGAMQSEYLETEDELAVLHVILGWDALQQHKYELETSAHKTGVDQKVAVDRPVPQFDSDLPALLQFVRFAMIPPDNSLDIILSKATYDNLLTDKHFLSRAHTSIPAAANGTGSAGANHTDFAAMMDICRQFWACNFVVKKGIVTANNLMIRYAQHVPVHRLHERTNPKIYHSPNYPILSYNYARFRPRATIAQITFLRGILKERELEHANQKWAEDNKHQFIIGAFHPLGNLIEKRR
jgi:hypothetical protein